MNIKKIALTSLLVALSANALEILDEEQEIDSGDEPSIDPNSENAGYYLMNEDELLQYLNPRSKELYHSLSDEGKKLAIQEASRRCNGMNTCKGLNACKTESNDCAGKGDCKGTGKCSFADKNHVIKLVAEKMAKKRNEL